MRARAVLAIGLTVPALVAARFNPWITALFCVLLTADLVRYRGVLSKNRFHFDGSRWWKCPAVGAVEPLDSAAAGYAGPWLLALSLQGQGRRQDLLLWRWQCRQESWRRLSLAALHGATRASPE